MSLLKEIDIRKSSRALDSKKIPRDVLNTIMDAAVIAPSCFNNQPWRFIVTEDENTLPAVKAALVKGNYWGQDAPAIVVVATQKDLDCKLSDHRDYALFDTGLAVENLILQAVKEGLIAHPIAGFDPQKIKAIFSIPDDYIVITLVVLGYPGDPSKLNEQHREMETAPRERKPREERVFFNQGW